MRAFRTGLAAMMLAVSTGFAAAGATEDQVTAAYTAWDAAFNKADAAAVGATYEADAVLLPSDHKVYDGPAGAETFFKGVLSSGVTGHKLELIKAYDAGDTVAAAAKWSAQGKDDKGNPATFTGLATHVFRKQADGSLKLIMHSFN